MAYCFFLERGRPPLLYFAVFIEPVRGNNKKRGGANRYTSFMIKTVKTGQKSWTQDIVTQNLNLHLKPLGHKTTRFLLRINSKGFELGFQEEFSKKIHLTKRIISPSTCKFIVWIYSSVNVKIPTKTKKTQPNCLAKFLVKRQMNFTQFVGKDTKLL